MRRADRHAELTFFVHGHGHLYITPGILAPPFAQIFVQLVIGCEPQSRRIHRSLELGRLERTQGFLPGPGSLPLPLGDWLVGGERGEDRGQGRDGARSWRRRALARPRLCLCRRGLDTRVRKAAPCPRVGIKNHLAKDRKVSSGVAPPLGALSRVRAPLWLALHDEAGERSTDSAARLSLHE